MSEITSANKIIFLADKDTLQGLFVSGTNTVNVNSFMANEIVVRIGHFETSGGLLTRFTPSVLDENQTLWVSFDSDNKALLLAERQAQPLTEINNTPEIADVVGVEYFSILPPTLLAQAGEHTFSLSIKDVSSVDEDAETDVPVYDQNGEVIEYKRVPTTSYTFDRVKTSDNKTFTIAESTAQTGDFEVVTNATIANIYESLKEGKLLYKGTWDASSDESQIVGTLSAGNYYVCATAGTYTPDGETSAVSYQVGDWAYYNGTGWNRISGNVPVTSVNGETGDIEIYKGAWGSGISLTAGSIVVYDGLLYLVIADVTGSSQTPDVDTTHFKLMGGGGGGGAVDSVNGKTGDVVLNATDIKLTTNQQTVQQNFIRIDEEVEDIIDKIPQSASAQNPLADKAFVNSSVQTATANFRGSWENWASVPTDDDDYPADADGNKTPTTNDYLVVQDASGKGAQYTGTWRFKYIGVWATDGKDGWQPEYQVNETPLTAQQIAALNSGITDTEVAQIATNKTDIATLNSTVANKVDKVTGKGLSEIASATVSVDGNTLTLTDQSGTQTQFSPEGSGSSDYTEINTEYVRIWDLNPGHYKLTYNSSAIKIYYRGSTLSTSYSTAPGPLFLEVVMKGTVKAWHMFAADSLSTLYLGVLYCGQTTESDGSVERIYLNSIVNKHSNANATISLSYNRNTTVQATSSSTDLSANKYRMPAELVFQLSSGSSTTYGAPITVTTNTWCYMKVSSARSDVGTSEVIKQELIVFTPTPRTFIRYSTGQSTFGNWKELFDTPLVITADSAITVSGLVLPDLSVQQVTDAYNAKIAGREVQIVDHNGYNHYSVIEANSISPYVSIYFDYTKTAMVEYQTNGTTVTPSVTKYSGGGGGGALYRHDFSVSVDYEAEGGTSSFHASFYVYSSSADPMTLQDLYQAEYGLIPVCNENFFDSYAYNIYASPAYDSDGDGTYFLKVNFDSDVGKMQSTVDSDHFDEIAIVEV